MRVRTKMIQTEKISIILFFLFLGYACDFKEKKAPISQILDMDIPIEDIFQEGVCTNLIQNVQNQCCGLIKDLKSQLSAVSLKNISICEQNNQIQCINNDDLNLFESTLIQGDQDQKVLSEYLANLNQGECLIATDALKSYQNRFQQCAQATCEVSTPLLSQSLPYCESDNLNISCGIDQEILYQPNLYPAQELLAVKQNAFELIPSEIVNTIAPPLPSISSQQTIELDSPISEIQFSIPSDFISHLMSRGGLRASLAPLFEQREEDRFSLPWKCNQNPLTCISFMSNLLKNALEVNLSQIRSELNLGMSAQTPMNAFEDDALQLPQNQSLVLDFKGIAFPFAQAIFDKGSVLLENVKPTSIRFDLSSFRLLPTHDPKAQNGYQSELSADAHQWINQAELIWDLPQEQCFAISTDIESTHLRERNNLVQNPYRCRCSAPPEVQNNGNWKPYCVIDPYPYYPQGRGDLQGINDHSVLFTCDQKGDFALSPDAVGQRLEITDTLYASLRSFISDDLAQFACQGLVGSQGDRLNTQLKNPNMPNDEQADGDAEHFGEYIAFEMKLPISGGQMRVKLGGDQELAVKVKVPLKQRWQKDHYRFDFEGIWTEESEFKGTSLAQDAEILFSLTPQNREFLITAKDETLIFHGALRYQNTSAGKVQIASLRRVIYERPLQRTEISGSHPLSFNQTPQNHLCRLSGIDSSQIDQWLNAEAQSLNQDLCDPLLVNQVTQTTIDYINALILNQLGNKLQKLYDYAITQAIFSKSKLGLWGYLMKAIQQIIWFEPIKISKYLDEQQAQDLNLDLAVSAQLWGPTAFACSAHDTPDLACPLMARFFGNRNSTITSINTQTSPLSLKRIFGSSALHAEYPPVLFCDNEKNVPSLTDLTQAQAQGFDLNDPALLRNRFLKQDFMQKDEDDPVVLSGVNAQCSVQIKQGFELREQSLFGGESKLKMIPTLRTQELINRIFDCRTLGHCAPDIPDSALDDGNKLASRAHLAMCSLIADVWYQPTENQDWISLVDVIKNSQLTESQSIVATLLNDYGLDPTQGARDFNARFANCSSLLRDQQYPISTQPILALGQCDQSDDCLGLSFCPHQNQLTCEAQSCVWDTQNPEDLSCLQNRSDCLSFDQGAFQAQAQNRFELQEELSLVVDDPNMIRFTELSISQGAQANEPQLLIVVGDQQQNHISMLNFNDQNEIQVAQPWQAIHPISSMLEQKKPTVLWNTSLNEGVILWMKTLVGMDGDAHQNTRIQFRFFHIPQDQIVLDEQSFEIASNAVVDYQSKYVGSRLFVLFKDQESQLLRLWTYHPIEGIASQVISNDPVKAFDLADDGSIAWINDQGRVFLKRRDRINANYSQTLMVSDRFAPQMMGIRLSPRLDGYLLIEQHQNIDQSIRLEGYAISEDGRVLRSEQNIDQINALLDQDFLRSEIDVEHPSALTYRTLLYSKTVNHPIQNFPIQVFYLQPIDEKFMRQGDAQLLQNIPLNQPKQTIAKIKLNHGLFWAVAIENQRTLKAYIQGSQCR